MNALHPRPRSTGVRPQLRILVVDDEAGIRESLEVLLSLENYAVKTAANGEEGLRMLDQSNFDLVLLDLALPGQSGLELLPQIQGAPARSAGHHDHGLRHRRQRRRGHSRRRGKFRPEALGQREAACRHSLRCGPPPRRRRKSPAQAHPQAALQLRQHRGQKRSRCCASSILSRRSRPAGPRC